MTYLSFVLKIKVYVAIRFTAVAAKGSTAEILHFIVYATKATKHG